MNVIVFLEDQTIIVNDELISASFTAPSDTRVVFWDKTHGHIEFFNALNKKISGNANYKEFVLPYVEVWQSEKDKRNKKQTLAKVKAQAFEALKNKRLTEEYKGAFVEVAGENIRFPSEAKDEMRLNSLLSIFEQDPDKVIPNWKVAEGKYISMTAPLAMNVRNATFAHISNTFSIEQAKRTEIEQLQTIAEVEKWLNKNLDKGW